MITDQKADTWIPHTGNKTVRSTYDDVDLNRAVAAYRFFYPSVAAPTAMPTSCDPGSDRRGQLRRRIDHEPTLQSAPIEHDFLRFYQLLA